MGKNQAKLPTTFFGNDIPAFSPNPALCMVPAVITAGSTKSDLDVDTLFVIHFRPTADVQVYFNEEPTKYKTFEEQVSHEIVLHPDATSIHFKNAGAASLTLEMWGM
jgi:hypothetical protein